MAASRLAFGGGLLAGALGGITGYKVINKGVHVEYEEKDPEKQNKRNRGVEILKHGRPVRNTDLMYYKNHVLCYDHAKKIPLWVAEKLQFSHLQGEANRKQSKFKVDEGVLAMYRSDNSDYLGSGWSRGHMAAAGNHKFDQQAMDETFLLSNIIPQNYQNNAGFWNRFEIYCRELTKKFPDVYVVSGPLTIANVEEDGKTFVMYEVIGKSGVSVPTHIFKVISIGREKENLPPLVAGFVVPNEPIDSKKQLLEYKVPIEYIEEKSGLQMLSKVDRKKTVDLCTVDDCKLMDYQKFELYFLGRRMEGARTLEALDKAWREIDKKKLKPDEFITNIYNRRKEELIQKTKSDSA